MSARGRLVGHLLLAGKGAGRHQYTVELFDQHFEALTTQRYFFHGVTRRTGEREEMVPGKQRVPKPQQICPTSVRIRHTPAEPNAIQP